jgi:hypothetical protein
MKFPITEVLIIAVGMFMLGCLTLLLQQMLYSYYLGK